MRKAVLLVVVVCGLCSAPPVARAARTGAPPPSVAELAAAERISAQEIRAHTRFLASDLLEGRGPGTRGDKLAQQYIAAQLEGMGLLPAGPDGSYFQRFELVGVTGHPESMKARGPAGELALRHWDELIAVSGSQKPVSKLSDAELVFVGYGIEAPEYDWDDFKGVDLRGKVLLMMNNDPEDDPALFGGRARLWYGRWDYKFDVAARKGAAGAIIIHTTASAGYPWKVVQTSWSGEQFELPADTGPRLEVKAWTTEEATRKLLALGGHDLVALTTKAQRREFKPVPLGIRVSTTFDNRVEKVETANVLAILPGSDARLKDELVVYTAHHDHLGKKEGGAPGEDVIFNGAVDNASGVAAMLTVARAMSTLQPTPKRSILFAAVAAEEQGLLGSEYLASHPPRAAGFLAANVNIDGVNFRGRTRDLTMIGLGKSSLDEVVLPLARAQHREVKPDQMPDRGFFYRSDQFNFARIGVPAVYLGSGLDFIGRPPGWGKQMREKWEAERYHQVSDEFDPEWDFSGAVEDARLYLLIGARVANAGAMPQWRKGDEFELARKRALESRTAGAAGR